MFTGLNFLLARQQDRERREAAAGRSRLRTEQTPVTRVTLRYAAAADERRLRSLAGLDSAPPVGDCALVAEVDGRLRAALDLHDGAVIADPFFRGAELVELLRLRASQLSAA